MNENKNTLKDWKIGDIIECWKKSKTKIHWKNQMLGTLHNFDIVNSKKLKMLKQIFKELWDFERRRLN